MLQSKPAGSITSLIVCSFIPGGPLCIQQQIGFIARGDWQARQTNGSGNFGQNVAETLFLFQGK